jgi:hypothetical protein
VVISATNQVPESFQVSHMICTTECGIDDGNQDLVHRDDQQDSERDGDRTVRRVMYVDISFTHSGSISIESFGDSRLKEKVIDPT